MRAFLIILSMMVSVVAQGSVKVQAYADRKEMGMGDTLTVTVSVQSTESVEISEPETPDLKGFQIVNSWTSSSTASRLVQGPKGMEFETQKSVDYHYMVTPTQMGLLMVPPFEVRVDGKDYRTPGFQIKVSKEGSGAAQVPQIPGVPDDLDEAEQIFNQLLQRRGGQVPKAQAVPKNPNEAFFIQLDLDKTEVFEGEQITANWFFYTRGNVMALDRLKFPDLKGFWKEIIEEVPALNFTQEVINGVPYRRALLASHALFPIKPGTSVVDEYKVKATVQLPAGPLGSFGFGQPFSYTRSSDRVKITVKPLPTEGKPQDFSGAVGVFDVQASVDGKEVPLNQPFALKIRFEGEGNAKLIELPSLGLPAGLESYDTKSDARFFKNGRSYKEFEVLVIPREPGEVVIPSISVSLFDPKQARYYTKKTEPITLKVVGEKLAENAPTGSGEPLKKSKEASAPARPELPPIITEMDSSSGLMRLQWWHIGLVTALSLLAVGYRARSELMAKEKKATLNELLKNRMKQVEKMLKSGSPREAAVQMNNAIYQILGKIAGEGGGTESLANLLAKCPPSLRHDLGAQIEKSFEHFQFYSFAPEEAIAARKDQMVFGEEVKVAAKLLEKAIEHVDTEN